VQKLKPIDIETWHTTLRASGRKDGQGGLSNRTIGHAHRVLSKALGDGARFDLVSKNVASDQGTPKVNADEMVILTDERVRDLVARLRGRVMYAAGVTALFTGLRRGELLAARWALADIDAAKVLQVREALEETKAHGVRFKKPKTKNGIRDVTLPDIVVDALRDHRRALLELRMALGLGKMPDDALIFPAMDGAPRSPRAFSADWADVAESIGMGDITLQALRPHPRLPADRRRHRRGDDLEAPRPREPGHHAADLRPPLPQARRQGRGRDQRRTGRVRPGMIEPGPGGKALGSNLGPRCLPVLSTASAKPLDLLSWKGGRAVEGTGLENRQGVHAPSWVRIPPLPPEWHSTDIYRHLN
jgi:integrase